MKGLKIVVWIVAIIFLLSFLGVILPWTAISNLGSLYDMDISGFDGLMKYGFRICLAGIGMIGVFFLMLALNPLKYGGMILLGGYGLLVCGLFCLVWGIYYNFTWWYWLFDVLFCWIFGGLILYLKSKAGQEKAAPAKTE